MRGRGPHYQPHQIEQMMAQGEPHQPQQPAQQLLAQSLQVQPQQQSQPTIARQQFMEEENIPADVETVTVPLKMETNEDDDEQK